MWKPIQDILLQSLHILYEAAPYLVFGYLAAGLLSVLLKRYQGINRLLTAPGPRPVVLAAVLGVPLPLCSCSVLPTALALRKEGASKGATSSFLISVPETDVISIILTYALLGPIMAIFRPLSALVTAITTGLVVNVIDGGEDTRAGESGGPAADEAKEPESCHCASEEDAPAKAGRHDEAVAPANAESCHDDAPAAASAKQKHWIVRALHFGFVEMFDDIMLPLLLGILLAGAVVVYLPSFGLEDIVRGTIWTYFVMLVIGMPVYVCATASTPLAVGLIAGGVSPGAALVFLLAGPATNIASLTVLRSQFGWKVLVGYLVSIGVVSVLMGMWLDGLIGPDFTVSPLAQAAHEHGGASVLGMACAFFLLVLAVVSAARRMAKRRSA